MLVKVRFGRRFAAEAGFPEVELTLPEGASAAALLQAVARSAPKLSCLDGAGRTVDLSVANLSVNGRSVDPRAPEAAKLKEGDAAYLFGVIGGG